MKTEPTKQDLKERIKTLEAKVKRLQQSKLDKFAAMAMQGFCANPYVVESICKTKTDMTITRMAIVEAKSLLDALEKEGE